MARRRYDVAARRLDHSVRTTWADYYYLGRSVTITGESLKLLRRVEGVARQQLAAGRLGHADLVRLQVEVARQEDRLATLEDRRRPLVARFNAFLDRPSTTPVPWPETLVLEEREPDEAKLLARLERSNPELTLLEAEMKTAEVRQQLARREVVPDFAIGVRTIETGSAIKSGTRGSGDDPWMLTVSVELPLWFSKYRAQRRAAEADWQAARRRHHERRNQVQVELQETLYARRDAARRLSLYTGTIVPKAREALEATEAAFRSGGSSFLDLIDAQRVWLEFQLAAERARADVLHAEAEIERLAGPPHSEGTGKTGKTGKTDETGRTDHD